VFFPAPAFIIDALSPGLCAPYLRELLSSELPDFLLLPLLLPCEGALLLRPELLLWVLAAGALLRPELLLWVLAAGALLRPELLLWVLAAGALLRPELLLCVLASGALLLWVLL